MKDRIASCAGEAGMIHWQVDRNSSCLTESSVRVRVWSSGSVAGHRHGHWHSGSPALNSLSLTRSRATVTVTSYSDD